MHRRHLLNLILASTAFALPFSASATQIRNARLWRSDEKLRLVFDLSGPVRYKTFTLSAPERLIIDVSGASVGADFSQLALNGTVIRSIRSGPFGHGDTRIVLDLSSPTLLNSFLWRRRTARVIAWFSIWFAPSPRQIRQWFHVKHLR